MTHFDFFCMSLMVAPPAPTINFTRLVGICTWGQGGGRQCGHVKWEGESGGQLCERCDRGKECVQEARGV
jgi:hypothetical protein